MDFPEESPVLILPHATLFPGMLLPMEMVHPRHKSMLKASLESNRMFVVALQRDGFPPETPMLTAGLGFVRAAVTRPDGESSVILQGLVRVILGRRRRLRPYCIYKISALMEPEVSPDGVEHLIKKVRQLVAKRLKSENPFGNLFPGSGEGMDPSMSPEIVNAVHSTLLNFLKAVNEVDDPARLADMVASGILVSDSSRQAILESLDVHQRLKRLIQSLSSEIRKQNK
jgi:ATP-dependent Lon protease